MDRTDTILWIGVGIFAVFAYKLTFSQLESFKKQCEVEVPQTRETVDKTTENALKLDTLAVLTKGVNYNLSRAAIRIVAERVLNPETLHLLLRKCQSTVPLTRLEALKTLRFLILSKPKSETSYYENENDHILSKECEAKFHTQPVFDALVKACINSLPLRLPDGSYTEYRDTESEKYALESLKRLITDGNLSPALQAGIVTYMKNIPTENHANIVVAFNDKEYQPESWPLFEIYSMMVSNDEAERYLKEAGIFVERPQKVVAGLNARPRGLGNLNVNDGHGWENMDPGPFQDQIERLHRGLMERYPQATSFTEALSLAEQDRRLNNDLHAVVWE